MGMIYHRKKRDPTTGTLEEQGPYWMKYYIEGRPIQESTKSFDRESAKRVLKIKEGDVASGRYRGPSMDRVYFEDLSTLVEQDYSDEQEKDTEEDHGVSKAPRTAFSKMPSFKHDH